MRLNIPFYSQHWNHDRFAEEGFTSREESEYWEKSSCGILCLKMAVDYFKAGRGEGLSPDIREYIRIGQEMSAYTDELGWSHDGLVRMAESFGLRARRAGKVTTDDLVAALKAGEVPLISIKWGFRPEKSLKERVFFWKKVGGHIAVVVGFTPDEMPTHLLVHHTRARHAEWNHAAWPVALDVFTCAFTDRAIFVRDADLA